MPDVCRAVERIGLHLAAYELVGRLDPRLTPTERLGLAARLAQARVDVAEAEAALATARSSYENKKKPNAESKALSDCALEEAESQVKSEEARLTADSVPTLSQWGLVVLTLLLFTAGTAVLAGRPAARAV